MHAPTLDQVRVLIAVSEAGSFSQAARRLNRAQSAVTHAVQKLERDTGLALFDRSGYRPVLTPAGEALLVRARRIAEEVDAFREQGRGLAGGLEAELTVALDSMCPMPFVVDALRAFSARFPTVPPRVHVRPLGAAARLVMDGTCAIGLLPEVVTRSTPLRTAPILTVELVPVVAPAHPLAAIAGMVPMAEMDRHVQLVLTDASDLTAGRDHGVLSSRTWRLADLEAKRSMLLGGLGWGSMPRHMVAEDLARGRLRVIRPEGFGRETTTLVIRSAHAADAGPGPAGRGMLDHLQSRSDLTDDW